MSLDGALTPSPSTSPSSSSHKTTCRWTPATCTTSTSIPLSLPLFWHHFARPQPPGQIYKNTLAITRPSRATAAPIVAFLRTPLAMRASESSTRASVELCCESCWEHPSTARLDLACAKGLPCSAWTEQLSKSLRPNVVCLNLPSP